MSSRAAASVDIDWHDGPRGPLRRLFELADDSSDEIDSYIELGRVLVARDEQGEIIGHLQLIPSAATETIELKSIAVREDWQGRGIGRRLIDRAVAVSRDAGVGTLAVTTATADIDNLRFYQRYGFRAASIERGVFTEARGYPPQLKANGIPVRDGITFTFALDAGCADD
jgi:GNAT superfamily N-acetyltransferase